MAKLFFLVSTATAYADDYGYHDHFFMGSGFTNALIIAIIFAVLATVIFYFGLCMSHKTISAATLPVWLVALVAAGVLSFVVTDLILIGSNPEEGADEESIGYKHSFYNDMEDYYIELQEGAPATEKKAMLQAKNDIMLNLDQGDDVALRFGLNTAIISIMLFYLFSILFKGFTVNGGAIPHLWPHGRKK